MTVTIEPRPYTDPDVQRLVAAVQAEYVRRYGGPDAAPVDPAEFDPPDGLFLVGLIAGQAVATGGWRRVDLPGPGPVMEIKRMFVLPEARRQGLAQRILAELERTAAAAGAVRLVLNTGVHQPEAIALYETAGYEAAEGYGLYACQPGARFYGKHLPPGATEEKDAARIRRG